MWKLNSCCCGRSLQTGTKAITIYNLVRDSFRSSNQKFSLRLTNLVSIQQITIIFVCITSSTNFNELPLKSSTPEIDITIYALVVISRIVSIGLAMNAAWKSLKATFLIPCLIFDAIGIVGSILYSIVSTVQALFMAMIIAFAYTGTIIR